VCVRDDTARGWRGPRTRDDVDLNVVIFSDVRSFHYPLELNASTRIGFVWHGLESGQPPAITSYEVNALAVEALH
jgi:hypothetical protein